MRPILILKKNTWFKVRFLFDFFAFARLLLDGLVGAISLLLETDVNTGQTSVAIHQAEIVVRRIVSAAYWNKVIGTSCHQN